MSQEVARTILNQLGGNRFVAMTGAKDLASSADALQFGLPARFAKKGINKVKITLTPADLYTMTFYKYIASRFELVTIAEVESLYADQLQDTFTEVTGLDTNMEVCP